LVDALLRDMTEHTDRSGSTEIQWRQGRNLTIESVVGARGQVSREVAASFFHFFAPARLCRLLRVDDDEKADIYFTGVFVICASCWYTTMRSRLTPCWRLVDLLKGMAILEDIIPNAVRWFDCTAFVAYMSEIAEGRKEQLLIMRRCNDVGNLPRAVESIRTTNKLTGADAIEHEKPCANRWRLRTMQPTGTAAAHGGSEQIDGNRGSRNNEHNQGEHDDEHHDDHDHDHDHYDDDYDDDDDDDDDDDLTEEENDALLEATHVRAYRRYSVVGWSHFEDAQHLHRLFPETFEAPTAQDIAYLRPNQEVKVCYNGERFWVVVTRIDIDREDIWRSLVCGEVDNVLHCPKLFRGDRVAFQARHIFSIEVFGDAPSNQQDRQQRNAECTST
jgi:hypothetical protein